MLSAAVTTAAMAATRRMYSGRRFESSSTSTAPAAGTTISIDRIGKSSELAMHQSTPCAITNQASSSTTPTPRISA